MAGGAALGQPNVHSTCAALSTGLLGPLGICTAPEFLLVGRRELNAGKGINGQGRTLGHF